MIRLASPLGLLAVVAGLLVWAAGFSVLYGLSALGCEFGWTDRALAGLSLFKLVLVLVWVLHIVMLAFLLRWSWMRPAEGRLENFLRSVGSTLAAAGFAAMIWTGLPILTTSPCL